MPPKTSNAPRQESLLAPAKRGLSRLLIRLKAKKFRFPWSAVACYRLPLAKLASPQPCSVLQRFPDSSPQGWRYFDSVSDSPFDVGASCRDTRRKQACALQGLHFVTASNTLRKFPLMIFRMS